jgi:hypothetical protein
MPPVSMHMRQCCADVSQATAVLHIQRVVTIAGSSDHAVKNTAVWVCVEQVVRYSVDAAKHMAVVTCTCCS